MIPAALILIASVTVFRLLGTDATTLANFSPLTAIILCAAIYLPLRVGALLAFGSLLLSDSILTYHYTRSEDYPLSQALLSTAPHYVVYLAVFALGCALRQQRTKPVPVFSAALGSSLLFYIVANAYAWISTPAYAKTLSGFIQAQTTGLPGFPPTWMFLRNSLASDLFFTALFFCIALITLKAPKTLTAESTPTQA